jgi:toxin ParE1/3/4
MRYHLVVTPAAFADVDAAMQWYDDQVENLGDRFISEIESRFENILQSPLTPRLLEGGRLRKVGLNHWPYLIYYRVLESCVRVIAVIHTSRDPKYITQRTES